MSKNILIVSNRHTLNTQYFNDPDALYDFLLASNDIETIVFVFWSWKVPNWVLIEYKCFGMHTGPLLEGKGKGGTPIENLKNLGVRITTLCAFEMNDTLDGGRVLVATPLYLEGTKDEIVDDIDKKVPLIVDFLTARQPEIPERFERIKSK